MADYAKGTKQGAAHSIPTSYVSYSLCNVSSQLGRQNKSTEPLSSFLFHDLPFLNFREMVILLVTLFRGDGTAQFIGE